jgi:phenylpropionate dioxygenase-like ring-hydroxylating dioxygenase large terminal subunit
MTAFVLTLPIAAGKVEAWRRFCQELSGSRRQQHEASRQRLGITAESLALIENLAGSASVTTLEALDLGAALTQLINSKLAFESWYRERLQELHGVHLTCFEESALPAASAQLQEVLFDWKLPADHLA